MKRFSNIIIYLVVGILSFLFFLYLSFPYNVLKETIAIRLSEASGLSVSINNLGPRLVVGLKAEGVKLSSRSGKDIDLKSLSAQVSLLYLFIGKVQVNFEIVDSADGNLDLDVGFGLFDLISGMAVPSSLSMTSQSFIVGNLVELGIRMQGASPTMSPLVKPLLEKISVTGKLNSKVDFSFNTSDFSRSTGTMSISLVDANVEFDPSMQIPGQKFESAVIKANAQGGNFTFDPASRFKSKDLDIAFLGKIIEKSKIQQSVIDMQIKVELFKELKNTFGVVFNAIAGKDVDGKLDVKISGPVIPGPETKIL